MQPLDEITPVARVFHASAAAGARLPWWLKLVAKIGLSRMLRSYRSRKALGVFRHGVREQNLKSHRSAIDKAIKVHDRFSADKVAALLELGPGDSVGTAIFAAARGVGRIWLVDVGDFAAKDMAVYARMVRMIDADSSGFAARVALSDRERMLASVGATYLTGGTSSLTNIPSGSVDVVFSSSVLEHVLRSEFPAMMAETFRVLRPGGTAHHAIDLMDHLGGGLNNLRFPEWMWEHPLMAKSGFYTNRLRFAEIMAVMRAAGFELAPTHIARWPVLPTPRRAMASPFRDLPEEELRIANFDILLRKPLSA